MRQSISKIGQKMPIAYRLTPVDKKEPSPLVEAGIEQQACLGLYRFHEAEIQLINVSINYESFDLVENLRHNAVQYASCSQQFIKPREAAEILGVNVGTLVRWEQDGKINAIKTPSAQRRYDMDYYIQRM